MNNATKTRITAAVAIIILLLLALCKMPYGYYMFLRLCLSIYFAIIGIVLAEKEKNPVAIILCAGIVMLYQPIIRIHLDKETWSILNMCTIPVIAALEIYLLRVDRQEKK